MNNQELSDNTPVIFFVLITIVVVSLYFAYKAAEVAMLPHVPSDKEMCEGRGGVYVTSRDGDRCFAREAFK